MLTYTKANTKADLEGILNLQKANLAQGLTPDEIQSQGFVTVSHTLDQVMQLNAIEKHIVAKDKDTVVGYVLAMTGQSKHDIPVLAPMFDMFDTIAYNGKTISAHRYLVVGQVCIAKAYRGQGVFDNCYAAYKAFYGNKYNFAITEIARANTRSLRAHRRIGFKAIHSYTHPGQTEWIVVVWDWKSEAAHGVL